MTNLSENCEEVIQGLILLPRIYKLIYNHEPLRWVKIIKYQSSGTGRAYSPPAKYKMTTKMANRV